MSPIYHPTYYHPTGPVPDLLSIRTNTLGVRLDAFGLSSSHFENDIAIFQRLLG
jgi:hypothetical protein